MYPPKVAETGYSSITEAGDSPPTPTRRARRTRRTIRGTKARNTCFFDCHCHLRHVLVLFCCWSITIGIATCSRCHWASVNRETTRSVRLLDNLKSRLHVLLLRRDERATSFGFYYGIPRTVIDSFAPNRRGQSGSITATDNDDVSLAKRRYFDGYESIGRDVEKWAEEILRKGNTNNENGVVGVEDEEEDDWTEIFCAKAFRHEFNNVNNSTTPITRQWVKWMVDSRGRHADHDDDQKHPCMKLFATIDAPLEIVCLYLSEKDRFPEYNSLLVDQDDVEILTPHSKVCWSQSKKLRKSCILKSYSQSASLLFSLLLLLVWLVGGCGAVRCVFC